MSPAASKAYRGLGMEGAIAKWYAKNTARDTNRFASAAKLVGERSAPDARVLEVAQGPGYLAIELAKSGRRVTGLDISDTFVRIARENAIAAGVTIDFEHGNASQMPFADGSFDFVICMAAFKNFADPVGALNEIYRVLVPGGQASILDLRKDASMEEITEEIRGMAVSAINAFVIQWVFRNMLLKRAYTQDAIKQMAAQSRFGGCEVVTDGVGFDWRLTKLR